MIQISGKVSLGSKKLILSKTNKDNVETFLKSNFDLNQISKIVFIQNYLILNFNATELLYIFLCYSRCQVSLYLWQIGPILQRCRVPKYYD